MNTFRETANVTIRPARPDDAEAIHAALVGIGETVGEVHKIKSTPQDIRRDGFGANAHFSTLIAEIDSGFAGMCLYFPIYSTWMGKPGAYVQDLFVDPKFRGLKVGEALLRRLAREEADAKIAAATAAIRESSGNLAERETAEELLKEAKQADRFAKRQDKAATTGTGLRTVWVATLKEPDAALDWAYGREPLRFTELVQQMANEAVRSGARSVPGFDVTEEKRV